MDRRRTQANASGGAELVAWHRQIMTTKINELRKAAATAAAAAATPSFELELDYSS